MRIALMNQGRAAIALSLNNSVKPYISHFEVGTAVNFTPDSAGGGALPAVVYNGSVANIRKTIVSNDELIISVILDNTVQIQSIGNVLLRLNTGEPFAWLVFDKPFGKKTINGEKHFAGDLQHQSFVLKIPNITSRLNLSNNPDFYSQPKNVATLNDLPRALLAGASEFIIQETDYFFNDDNPVYAVRVNNQWWGVPNMKSFNDETFGTLDGGTV